MKLVVTGASGFIGRNVLLRAPRDWEIVAVSRDAKELEAFATRHGLSQVRVVQCDLLEAADVRSLSRKVGGRSDAMLYLAANGDPAASVEHPRMDLEANTVAFVNCLEHCGAAHVVYVSSGAVYDGLRGPVSPDSGVSPRLPYAISKLASEQYLRFFAECRQGVASYVNVRFFGAYGPYEPARKVTTKCLTALAAGQRTFVVRGDGENLVDFMFVGDAVDGFLALARARGMRKTLDFYAGTPVSVNQVVETIARVVGVKLTVRHEGVVPEYIQFRSVDTTMSDILPVTQRVPLEEGLRQLQSHLASVPPVNVAAR